MFNRTKSIVIAMCFIPFLSANGNVFYGELHNVENPREVVLKLESGNLMRLKLLGPDFGESRDVACDTSLSNERACELLREMLTGNQLGIIVEEVEGETMYGDIVVRRKALSLSLIREGHYRVDTDYNRSHALLEAEQEARCNYRGMWAKWRGNYEIAKSCAGW